MARSSVPICLVLFLLLAGLSAAEEAFWVHRSEPLKESGWVAFVPANKEFAKQAVLVYAELPPSDGPVVVRQVLSEMYHQVKGLKVLGRKPVPWRQSEGTLVSFSGRSGKNKVVGRALIASGDRGTEVLLLVRHPFSDHRIVKSYELVRKDIESFLLTVNKDPRD